MISLLTFICSLCVQFASVNYPVDIVALNESNYNLVNTMISSINNNFNYSLDPQYAFVVNRNNSTYPYYLFYPKELIDNSVSSSISASSRNDTYVTIVSTNFLRFQINASGGFATGTTPSVNNIGNVYFSNTSNQLLYNAYYTLPIDDIDTFVVDHQGLPPIIDFEGHASGWGDTLEDVDGVSYNVLGHSDITNADSFDLVTSSSSTVEKLLKAIGRITSSMNDSLSFGLGTLISLFNRGLSVIGLDDLAFNVSATYNYLAEPFDYVGFMGHVNHSSLGRLISEVGSIDFTAHSYNPDDIVIRWNLTSIYPGAVGSFNLSSALDGSKSVWQPLIICFLYATLCWNLLKGLPNLLNGVSSVSSDVRGRVK